VSETGRFIQMNCASLNDSSSKADSLATKSSFTARSAAADQKVQAARGVIFLDGSCLPMTMGKNSRILEEKVVGAWGTKPVPVNISLFQPGQDLNSLLRAGQFRRPLYQINSHHHQKAAAEEGKTSRSSPPTSERSLSQ
jgi:transcriptional regulator of acetoin/glycerol metabolism